MAKETYSFATVYPLTSVRGTYLVGTPAHRANEILHADGAEDLHKIISSCVGSFPLRLMRDNDGKAAYVADVMMLKAYNAFRWHWNEIMTHCYFHEYAEDDWVDDVRSLVGIKGDKMLLPTFDQMESVVTDIAPENLVPKDTTGTRYVTGDITMESLREYCEAKTGIVTFLHLINLIKFDVHAGGRKTLFCYKHFVDYVKNSQWHKYFSEAVMGMCALRRLEQSKFEIDRDYLSRTVITQLFDIFMTYGLHAGHIKTHTTYPYALIIFDRMTTSGAHVDLCNPAEGYKIELSTRRNPTTITKRGDAYEIERDFKPNLTDCLHYATNALAGFDEVYIKDGKKLPESVVNELTRIKDFTLITPDIYQYIYSNFLYDTNSDSE
jgi:hypothetical protein